MEEKCRLLPHCFYRQSRLTVWQSPRPQCLFLIRLGSCRIHPGTQRPNIYLNEFLALSFLTWMRWQALMTLVWNTWCLIAKLLLWPVVYASSFTCSQLKLTEEWTEKLGITPTTHVVMWELSSYRTNLCVLTRFKVMTLMEFFLLLEPYSCLEASVTRAPVSLMVAFPDGPTKTYLLRLLIQLNLNQRIILPQI